ncbi:MAG: DUF86 domain-containing protein [Candidatus Thermoplasmatota archaeon]
MTKERYIKKIENFEKEKEYIKQHEIKDDTTERAVLYSLQVCVEVTTDIIAMKVKDIGLVVEDDYSNIEKLMDQGIITEEEANLLRRFNGVRNAVVHKYDKLDIDIIKKALDKIDELSDIVYKIAK